MNHPFSSPPDPLDTQDIFGKEIRLPDNIRHHTDTTAEIQRIRGDLSVLGKKVLSFANFRQVAEFGMNHPDQNWEVHWIPNAMNNKIVEELIMFERQEIASRVRIAMPEQD